MTRKLAIFVEGQTEQLFLKRLVIELANQNDVSLCLQNRRECPILMLEGQSEAARQTKYFVLIYDCQSDGQVKSKIIESARLLSEQGYFAIIGLQDLYPLDLSEVTQLRAGLRYGLPEIGIDIGIHVAVAEIEAWFLQEGRHFESLHHSLTPAYLKTNFGFDPDVDSAELVPHPASMLKSVYNSVSLGYKKRRAEVTRTVEALDIENLCIGCCNLIPSFVEFSARLNQFLSANEQKST